MDLSAATAYYAEKVAAAEALVETLRNAAPTGSAASPYDSARLALKRITDLRDTTLAAIVARAQGN